MKIDLQYIPRSMALVMASMIIVACEDLSEREFEYLCMQSFAFQIHSEPLWREYISRTTNWLDENSYPIDPTVRPI